MIIITINIHLNLLNQKIIKKLYIIILNLEYINDLD